MEELMGKELRELSAEVQHTSSKRRSIFKRLKIIGNRIKCDLILNCGSLFL